MFANRPLVIVLLVIAVHAIAAFPPNINRGYYRYDPDSIPQNEQVLKLFLHLAAHTANRLIHLKSETHLRPKLTYKNNGTFGDRQRNSSRFVETSDSFLGAEGDGKEGSVARDRTISSDENQLKVQNTEKPKIFLSEQPILQEQGASNSGVVDERNQLENFLSTTVASLVNGEAIFSSNRPPETTENVSNLDEKFFENSSRNSLQSETPSTFEKSSADLQRNNEFTKAETTTETNNSSFFQPREIANSILKPLETNLKNETIKEMEKGEDSDGKVEIATRLFFNSANPEFRNAGIPSKITQVLPSTVRPVNSIIQQLPGTDILRSNISPLDTVISSTDDLASSIVHQAHNNSAVNNISDVNDLQGKLSTGIRKIVSPVKSTVEEVPSAAGDVVSKSMDKPQEIIPLFRAFPEAQEIDNEETGNNFPTSTIADEQGFSENYPVNNGKMISPPKPTIQMASGIFDKEKKVSSNIAFVADVEGRKENEDRSRVVAEFNSEPTGNFARKEENMSPENREELFLENSAIETDGAFPLYGQTNSDDDFNGSISEATLKEIADRLVRVLQSANRKRVKTVDGFSNTKNTQNHTNSSD